jgi:titin
VSIGQTYWYQVVAVNAIGPSPKSNELSARLIATPSAPTLLAAATDGAAILSWTPPSNDGGSNVTGYRIYRKIGTGSESFLDSTTALETTYLDGGLTNGTQYTYRVAAVNAAGEGAKSAAATVTPGPPSSITAPSAPQNLVLTRPKNVGAIQLRWSAPASDGGSPVSSYFIYRRAPGETSFTLIDLTDPSTRAYTDSGLLRRETYTYYVTAFNSYYEGPASNQASLRTK